MKKLFFISFLFIFSGCASPDVPTEMNSFHSIFDRNPEVASDFKLPNEASRSAQILLSTNTKNMIGYSRALQSEAKNRGYLGSALKEIDFQRSDPSLFVSLMTEKIKNSFDSVSLINDIGQFQKIDNNYLVIVDMYYRGVQWTQSSTELKIKTPILDKSLKLTATPSAGGEFLFGLYSEPFAVKIKQESDFYQRIFDQYGRNLNSAFPSRRTATLTLDKADKTGIDQCIRSALLINDADLKRSAIKACGS